jgi:hypothetical protein
VKAIPYELTFKKALPILDQTLYFNECCYGGDLVVDRLLPSIEQRYSSVFANQEDWGWFIWFQDGVLRLGVNIFCDDPGAGIFRLHLAASRRRWFVFDEVSDGAELDELRRCVESALKGWVDDTISVCRLDRKFHPLATQPN